MIRLGTNYGIQPDTDCWQFGRVGTRKNKEGKNEEYLINPCYPTTLQSALEKYAQKEVLDANPESWGEVLEALRTVREEIATVSAALAVGEAA